MNTQQHIHFYIKNAGRILSAITLFAMLCVSHGFAQQWKEVRNLGKGTYHSVCFQDSLHGWVGGIAKSIVFTTNGGITWDTCNSINGDINDDINAIHFFDTQNGLATMGKYIIKSTDGGKNWTQFGKQYTTSFYSMDFVTNKRGWAVGTSGGILTTTDGGENWTKQISDTFKELYTVCFTDTLNGWIGGRDATFFHTTDGGKTWKAEKPVNLEPTAYINDIFFHDALHGWAVGVRNRTAGQVTTDLIIATTDGGKTWTEQATTGLAREGAGLFSVSFANNLKGWAVGSDGIICKTTDGGATWKLNWDGLTKRYPYWRSVFMVNERLGFVVGDPCAIIRYSDISTTIESGDDNKLTIASTATTAIYPNPVSNKAMLRFNVPQSCTVGINVYDIRGVVVTSLQQHIEAAGTTDIELPVQELCNGIYAVRITVGDKVETRTFIVSR